MFNCFQRWLVIGLRYNHFNCTRRISRKLRFAAEMFRFVILLLLLLGNLLLFKLSFSAMDVVGVCNILCIKELDLRLLLLRYHITGGPCQFR